MIDLVYIYKEDLQHEHFELRYSVRSMYKHLTGIRNLIIVGDDPGFLQGHIHIQHCYEENEDPAVDIAKKILKACADQRVSDRFLLCSDDHYLLEDYIANDFPYFQCGPLSQAISMMDERSQYRMYLTKTEQALQARNLPTQNFQVHSPVVYHKLLLPGVMKEYALTRKEPVLIKSIYCNTLKIEGQFHPDIKFKAAKDSEAGIFRKIGSAAVFSTNEHSLNEVMKRFMQRMYPHNSPWEHSPVII